MNFLKKALCGALLAGTAFASHAATFIGDRTDFRDETIYFAMTTRFYDGDPSNNTYCWDGVNNINDPEWRGDFKGLIEKLDYIKALGFTAVWITPVVENASGLDYHGYHAFNFKKVDPRYESQDCKFQDLIDAAHARGMKIVLDIVLQHTGNFGEETLCPMFEKDYTQPHSNINKILKLHPQTKLPANYYSLIAKDQYASRLGLMKNTRGKNEDVHNYWHHYAHFNWDNPTRWWGQIAGDCVDLNTENAAVSNYIVSCYTKFIEMGVDAFRIDTGGHISRLTFNKMFNQQFLAAGEKYKAKRGGTPFFMYTEVCARSEEVIYRGQNYNCSPCFYTWKEEKDYAWDMSETSWDNYVVMEGETGDHVNAKSVLQQADDYLGHDFNMAKSNNAFLNGNEYRTEDYSKYSGLSIIDFPMHWRFHSAQNAFSVRSEDDLYNDARYNVVYVDSHDYGPNGWDTKSFGGSHEDWAENFALMFTWRGIPCIYYGSEAYFRKGGLIDKGAIEPLDNTSRAYFGGYLTGSVKTTDFATYTDATGNMAATLSHPLALNLQRLNKIRAAVPALRKGQYSTEGCSGKMAFKRRYVDANTDSYVLVTISGDATFTGVLNGTYTDVVTGDVKTVTDGTLTATCKGQGNLRAYVLSTAKTPAPGKIGNDTKFIFDTTPADIPQAGYDGNEEAKDMVTVRDSEVVNPGPGPVEEPDEPIAPSMKKGEQAVFFETDGSWNACNAWVWNGATSFNTTAWPGEAMTYLGNNVWKWNYAGDKKVSGMVIFSNAGNSQTSKDGWAYVNGGYYNASGYVKTIEGAGDIEGDDPVPPTPVDGNYTVYFDNTKAGFSEVYVWAWDAAHNGKNYTGGTWPGKKMELDAKTGYYKFSCTVEDENPQMMVIFSDGNGTQTGNFTMVHDGVYTFDGFSGAYAGIGAVETADLKVYVSDHRLMIESPAHTTVTVTRADGVAFPVSLHTGLNTVELPRGFYIVAGKKIIL